jgi:hypothetical protein
MLWLCCRYFVSLSDTSLLLLMLCFCYWCLASVLYIAIAMGATFRIRNKQFRVDPRLYIAIGMRATFRIRNKQFWRSRQRFGSMFLSGKMLFALRGKCSLTFPLSAEKVPFISVRKVRSLESDSIKPLWTQNRHWWLPMILISMNHDFETLISSGEHQRSRASLAWFMAGSLHYLFVQVSVFVCFDPPLDLTNISILVSEESVVTTLQRLLARNIMIFLMYAQFHRLKSKVTSFWTSALNSSRTATIANMRDYSRDRFVLMDQIHKIGEPQLPFPHTQSFNPGIFQFIRLKFEKTPC